MVPRTASLQHFLYLQYKYPCAEFYSNASKTCTIVSRAAHGPNFIAFRAMSVHTSIFSADACGILVIVQYILEKWIPYSIYTDSLSFVPAL